MTLVGDVPPALTWTASAFDDGLGILWMYGGYNFTVGSYLQTRNDLYSLDRSGLFTRYTTNIYVNYPATSNTTSATVTPGARGYSNMWVDSNHNLWLQGGFCSGGFNLYSISLCNDMFWLDTSTTQNGLDWYWMKGDNSTMNAIYPLGMPFRELFYCCTLTNIQFQIPHVLPVVLEGEEYPQLGERAPICTFMEGQATTHIVSF